jgi:hypothetical protein
MLEKVYYGRRKIKGVEDPDVCLVVYSNTQNGANIFSLRVSKNHPFYDHDHTNLPVYHSWSSSKELEDSAGKEFVFETKLLVNEFDRLAEVQSIMTDPKWP